MLVVYVLKEINKKVYYTGDSWPREWDEDLFMARQFSCAEDAIKVIEQQSGTFVIEKLYIV